MVPLVDTHCHLLAGLDDGPKTIEEAVQMCRIAYEDGTRTVAATAHLNEQWPEVTPDRIRAATALLSLKLKEIKLPLSVYPSSEVMVRHDLVQAWGRNELLSLADLGKYLLIELPSHVYLDLRKMISDLMGSGVRPILAHPERHPEFLYERNALPELTRRGCLVQVSSGSITHPQNRRDARALRTWICGGLVHLVASDGHSSGRRAPRMKDAYGCVASWAGMEVADRLCSSNGLAVLSGLPVRHVPRSRPAPGWFSGLFAGGRKPRLAEPGSEVT